MSRLYFLASACALLPVAAHAQCLQPPTGTSVLPGIVQWNSSSGYGSTYVVDDEGITNPPIALTAFASFPMAGAVGTLDQMWINTNGEIYLTDSSLGLTQPSGAALFGVTSIDEMRGSAVGAAPRIVPLSHDQEGSDNAGAAWDIFVDQTVPGQVRVYYQDMSPLGVGADEYDFAVTLFSSGAMEFAYSSSSDFLSLTLTRYVGVSIGNGVGSSSSPESDLSASADSGTLGLLFQAFGVGDPLDLAGRSLLLLPNGMGGYATVVTCEPAYHEQYGQGCYSCFAPSGTSHESAMAATTSFPLRDEGMSSTGVPLGFTFPMAGAAGPLSHIFVHTNGEVFLTDGSSPVGVVNYGLNTLAELRGALGDSPRIVAWDQDLDDLGPGAWDIKLDQTATTCKVTWENASPYSGTVTDYSFSVTLHDSGLIECSYGPDGWQSPMTGLAGLIGVSIGNAVGTGTELPVDFSSLQDSGSLGLIFETFASGGPGNDLAGKTLAFVPNGLGGYTSTLTCDLTPPSLSASPAPTYTLGGSSVPMTWQMDNLRDLSPPAPGLYLALLVFSLNPPIGGTGIDLALVGIDAPGCTLLVGSVDVPIGVSGFTPSIGQPVTFPQPLSPGDTFYSQAANFIIPNSLPNGLNNFGLTMSNGVRSVFQTN